MGTAIPTALAAALDDYAHRLQRRFGSRLRLVRLFGSWARGQAGPDSDVDVAVVVDGLTRAEWGQAIDDAVDAEGDGDAVLAPFVLSAARFDELVGRERRIARDILAEGVPL